MSDNQPKPHLLMLRFLRTHGFLVCIYDQKRKKDENKYVYLVHVPRSYYSMW